MKHLVILVLAAVLTGAGYYYYVRQPADIQTVNNDINTGKQIVVNTANTGIDSAIQSALKGVGSFAPIYYVQNGRNYGASATQNICNDTTNTGSIGNIISNIQKYTNAVRCDAATDYPSRSFTIVAPSKVNVGKYYCADQSGIVSLINSVSYGPFEQGIKCE